MIFPDIPAGVILKEIDSFLHGNGRLYKTLGMYFDRLRLSYTRKDSKYTPMQVLESEELLEQLWQRVDSKPRLFETGRGTVLSFFIAIGVGWSKCRSVANFPVREAKAIYEKYCPQGGLIYDPSAGFGSRMSAALLGGYGYVATDPNKDLFPCLNQYHQDLLLTDYVRSDQYFKIYCQGSEELIPELVGKIDFAFTSPPYFDLEKYSDDDSASTKHYDNFGLWGKHYVIPTVKNIREYLKPGACVGINIKNLPGYPLYDKWQQVFRKIGGFKELEPHRIAVLRRNYGVREGESVSERLKNYFAYADGENCMIFQKE